MIHEIIMAIVIIDFICRKKESGSNKGIHPC